ncbi:fatty acid CoA ligase family protein [Kitasatospora sp. GAS204B]|uniref:fatty acid CoA ligase family protein n=1 Tax=unclassified Kitasatospora TaxID=2633591 RepID=UPI0024764435|nr:fatty acid CoA ligase family protein [Kitasatospora sp. GAS204B]MDH6119825.1 acyl-CoA synthetase (AMP-forming)/AMP-acid ligase II [Kitasatospora sp. GAS204B]
MTSLAHYRLESQDSLADQLAHNADAFPSKVAIISPDGRIAGGEVRYRELSYQELQAQVEQLANELAAIGITKGMRTVLMAAPGPELFALAFALFRLGAVPVVVDPGMGVRRMLHCYRTVGAEAFIGPPIAHAVRVLGWRTFASIRITVTLGRRWFWGGHTLEGLRRRTAEEHQPRTIRGSDLMMIGFTTGSTGPAKGVEYTHAMATAMARQIQAAHGRHREEVSLVTLPLYGILDLLFGSTLVLAPVAPAKVAHADPGLLVAALTRFDVSTMFASPALLRVLAEHLECHNAELPALRCVVSGGAPVPAELVAKLSAVLDSSATVHVTYGATEALPISSVQSAQILHESADLSALGDGTCVGRPLAGIEVRIIPVTDLPVASMAEVQAHSAWQVGEITVAGPAVSRRYHAAPAADRLHKIHDDSPRGPAKIWHRTGDLGYLDAMGRLWFCGRKSQRVRTGAGDLHTVRCEGVFNAHPLVRRSALVGVGEADRQRPVVCVETQPGVGRRQWRRVRDELHALAAANPVTQGLGEFLRHRAFPVDVRHNAKIGREELARWAQRQLQPQGRRWALRTIPLAGWAYLLLGAVHPVDSIPLSVLWWIDAFLSVVVHAAQIPVALPRGRAAGRRPGATIALTMLYGATWWRSLSPTAKDGVA